MVDYIKIRIISEIYADQLRKNALLRFKTLVYTDTWEIAKSAYTAYHRGLKFMIFDSGLVEISGSIHKYYNYGRHNHNYFSHRELCDAISSLINQFDINPDLATIHGLEIGFNIKTPFNPDIFISHLNNYKKSLFQSMSISAPGFGRECIGLSQYLIKIYNKGLQYGLKHNILRIEIKFKKMEVLKKGKITLSDLTTNWFLLLCHDRLMRIYDSIIINEILKIHLLSKAEKKVYDLYKHPDSWQELTDSKDYNYYKNRFNTINEKYAESNLKRIVRDLLLKEKEILETYHTGNWDNLTGLDQKNAMVINHSDRDKISGQSDHLDIQSFYPVNIRTSKGREVKLEGNVYNSETFDNSVQSNKFNLAFIKKFLRK